MAGVVIGLGFIGAAIYFAATQTKKDNPQRNTFIALTVVFFIIGVPLTIFSILGMVPFGRSQGPVRNPLYTPNTYVRVNQPNGGINVGRRINK